MLDRYQQSSIGIVGKMEENIKQVVREELRGRAGTGDRERALEDSIVRENSKHTRHVQQISASILEKMENLTRLLL